MSIERLKLKVSCPQREWGDTTVYIERYTDDKRDIILPVNICNQGNGSAECMDCICRIWEYFKADPQRIRHTYLFRDPFYPLKPPDIESNL